MTVKLTQEEIEDLMIYVSKLLLNVPETDHKSVRIPYGASSETGSAPSHNPNSNVCYINVSPTDDGYGKQHHISYINGEKETDAMTEIDQYTEQYSVIFSCYGQESFENARLIRDGLYTNTVKSILGKKNVYIKPHAPQLVQTHDLINTQWVKRCDVTATFYNYIRIERQNVVQPIEHVRIALNISNKYLHYGE